MELRGAIASHVGNVRENNQDRAHFGGFVAVVADGMGGHQGGEMAASIAISEFTEVVAPIVPGGLVDLVEEANRAVFERAADPDLRGMGTTLVAMTLRPTEEKISVVNVGDSRAYFLRGDELGQLTLDHSLVEDLVRQNRLTKEEALTHPQRNILTRALGIASQVEVDRFLVPTKIGDRFLLCSDGLFNEVTEVEITRIMLDNPEPNEAADALVMAALDGPGRDNITVAVVDIVESGEGGNVSSEATETLLVPAVSSARTVGPDGPGQDVGGGGGLAAGRADRGGAVELAEPPTQGEVLVDDHPLDVGANEDVLNDEVKPVADRLSAPEVGEVSAVDTETFELDDRPIDPAADTGEFDLDETLGARRSKLKPRLVGLIGLGVLAAIAYVGLGWYAERTWFVADENGQVALFRGRPGGLLWAEPTIERVTEIQVDGLTDESLTDLASGRTFGSLEEAEDFVTDELAMPAAEEAASILEEVEPTDESAPVVTPPEGETTTGSAGSAVTEEDPPVSSPTTTSG